MINFKKLFASKEVKIALNYLEDLKRKHVKVSHLINKVFSIVEKSLLESGSELIKYAHTKGNVRGYVDNEVRDVIKGIILNSDIFFTFGGSTYAEQGYDLIDIYNQLIEESIEYEDISSKDADKDIEDFIKRMIKCHKKSKKDMDNNGGVTYYYDTDLDLVGYGRFTTIFNKVIKKMDKI